MRLCVSFVMYRVVLREFFLSLVCVVLCVCLCGVVCAVFLLAVFVCFVCKLLRDAVLCA